MILIIIGFFDSITEGFEINMILCKNLIKDVEYRRWYLVATPVTSNKYVHKRTI